MRDYICIRRFDQIIDAEMVAGLLEYRGIRAVVRTAADCEDDEGERAGGLIFEVCVSQRTYEEADSILRSMLSDLL